MTDGWSIMCCSQDAPVWWSSLWWSVWWSLRWEHTAVCGSCLLPYKDTRPWRPFRQIWEVSKLILNLRCFMCFSWNKVFFFLEFWILMSYGCFWSVFQWLFSSVQFTCNLGPVWIPLDHGIQPGIQKPSLCNPQAVCPSRFGSIYWIVYGICPVCLYHNGITKFHENVAGRFKTCLDCRWQQNAYEIPLQIIVSLGLTP
jgi:hypothetical protein